MNNSWLIYVRIIVFCLFVCLFIGWLVGWLVYLFRWRLMERKIFQIKAFTEKVKLSFSWIALFPLGAEEILLIASCL